MKIPNLPQVNIAKPSFLDPATANKFKQAVDNYQPDPQLEKYQEMENAPVIPYEDPFKGRNASNLDIPHFFGMRHYRVTPNAIDMSNPNQERTYQYGELTDEDDINAFLDQLDRLDGEHKVMFEHLKPSKELLELAEKLSDEELAQFAEFMVEVSRPDFFRNRKSEIPEDLISTLNSMSEDVLSSSIDAMSAVLAQGKSYQKTASPIGVNEHGREDYLFVSQKEGADITTAYSMNNAGNDLAKNFAKLLTDNKLNDGQLVDMNSHITLSSFEQTRGIVDMASLVSKHQLDDMLSMLGDADKDSEQNIFAYLGQQVNHQAHRQYYEMDNGDFVVQQDEIASESDRRALYENVLTAFNEYGLGWIDDTLKEVQGTPAQMQKQVWQQLLEDKENNPDDFVKSDSLETWAVNNLAKIEVQFHAKQTMKIYEFNSERVLPDILGNMRFYASGNHNLDIESDEQQSPQA